MTEVYLTAEHQSTIQLLMELLKDFIVPLEAASKLLSNSQPWKETVMNWLQVYPATPHAATSISPHELLYGRKMRTKLDILPLLPATSSLDTSARQAAQKQQDKVRSYTDAKRGARTPPFQPGERVRIRKLHHVPKAHPRFTSPATVRKIVGSNSFLLSDGKTWNASHLAHFPSVTGQDCDTQTSQQSHADNLTSKKQPRAKYKPKWHKDYVMP